MALFCLLILHLEISGEAETADPSGPPDPITRVDW